MCYPEYFGINYKINPWMNPENQVNHSLAIEQWLNLKQTLESLGVEIALIEPKPNLPDMVFTANAGLIVNNTFFPSRFKHPERQGEETHFIEFFKQLNYNIKIINNRAFEGAGDCLFLKDELICGHGYRTFKSSYYDIPCEKAFLELGCDDFYHLDTCFCPLKNEDFLFYRHAFMPEANETLDYLGNGISVSIEEAYKFACNAVCIDDNVILPDGCSETENKLKDLGYKTFAVDMSEFLKSGGACKCLTLKLN